MEFLYWRNEISKEKKFVKYLRLLYFVHRKAIVIQNALKKVQFLRRLQMCLKRTLPFGSSNKKKHYKRLKKILYVYISLCKILNKKMHRFICMK